MLAPFHHGHNSLARLAIRPVLLQARGKVTTTKSKTAKAVKAVKAKTAPKAKLAKPEKAKSAKSAKSAAEAAEKPAGKTKSKSKTSPMISVTSDIAHQLNLTGVWKRTGGRKKADAIQAIEPRRVNIVSEGLCGMVTQNLQIYISRI